jgi:HEPN domain-containing protein
MLRDPRAIAAANQWLRYAQSDLAYARGPQPIGGLLATLCFHAQQATEKSLKAVLVVSGIDIPRTHNLVRLIDLLPADVRRIPALDRVARLTPYATATRYPGLDEDVTDDEYVEALELATAVVNWAEVAIKGST